MDYYYGDESHAAAASPGMAADPTSRPESFFDRIKRLARASPSSFPLVPSIRVSSVSITPTGITFVVPLNHHPDHDGIGGGGYDDAYRNGGFGAMGASGEAIASLPKATVVAREKADCAVCLEGYEVGEALRTMPCKHDFHERCIVDWLRVSRMCPLCRFKLPPADETEESDTEEEEEDADGASSTC